MLQYNDFREGVVTLIDAIVTATSQFGHKNSEDFSERSLAHRDVYNQSRVTKFA